MAFKLGWRKGNDVELADIVQLDVCSRNTRNTYIKLLILNLQLVKTLVLILLVFSALLLVQILDQILGPCEAVLFFSWAYYRCIDKFVLEICYLGLATLLH